MPSNALSGNQGVALVGGSKIAELTKWSMDQDPGVQTYFSQAGVQAGICYPRTVQGNMNLTGEIEGKIDFVAVTGTASQLSIGALITLVLYHKLNVSWRSFNVRITKFHTEADIDSGAPQPFTASWQLDGPITTINV